VLIEEDVEVYEEEEDGEMEAEVEKKWRGRWCSTWEGIPKPRGC
jgi:hypothetical protein